MFNWIVSDTWQYLKSFNFVDKTELFEIEFFLHLCVNEKKPYLC